MLDHAFRRRAQLPIGKFLMSKSNITGPEPMSMTSGSTEKVVTIVE